MNLGRHVKYWGRNALAWTGISLGCALGFWLLQGLSGTRYVQGTGLAATFLVYLSVIGAFVSVIAVISEFQLEIPRLVSLNVTRKAAVWGLVAGHGATAFLHMLLGVLAWCIFGSGAVDEAVFIISLLASVMLGFGCAGILLGAAVLRWGKIGSVIMAAAIMVMSGALGGFIAMQGKDFLQGTTLEKILEYNLWPLALIMAVLYLAAGAVAALLTRKIEVRV